MLAAAWITAVATGLLAILAGVTAWYARNAFLKQSQEVRAIERQVHDQEELTRQQAELLKVQSGQLELQRHQLDDQRQANAKQAEVLELQAAELRESLDQRQRDADEQRRSQAAKVTALFATDPKMARGPWGALIRNASDLPVFDVRVSFHYIQEKWPGGDWAPVLRGSPPERSASSRRSQTASSRSLNKSAR